MAAFWAVFTFGDSGPAITAHGSLDLKQEIQIQIQIQSFVPDKTSLKIHQVKGQTEQPLGVFQIIRLFQINLHFTYSLLMTCGAVLCTCLVSLCIGLVLSDLQNK
jgi:hypothetical protein